MERSGLPQHLAFSTDHIVDLAREARDRGLGFLTVPDNYYDDLVARFDLDPETVARLRELGLLYDREAGGEFVHFYTATVGEVFFEVVQRNGGYDGYGAGLGWETWVNGPSETLFSRLGTGNAVVSGPSEHCPAV